MAPLLRMLLNGLFLTILLAISPPALADGDERDETGCNEHLCTAEPKDHVPESPRSLSRASPSPVMNSRKITPNSAKARTPSRSEITMWLRNGTESINRARPRGPMGKPTTRNPRTGLMRYRFSNGTTTDTCRDEKDDDGLEI